MEIALADTSAAYSACFGHGANMITIIARYNNINKFELKSISDPVRDIIDNIVIMLR